MKTYTFTSTDVANRYRHCIPNIKGESGALYDVVAEHCNLIGYTCTFPDPSIITTAMKRVIGTPAMRLTPEIFRDGILSALDTSYPELPAEQEEHLRQTTDMQACIVEAVDSALDLAGFDPDENVTLSYAQGGQSVVGYVYDIARLARTIYVAQYLAQDSEQTPFFYQSLAKDAQAEFGKVMGKIKEYTIGLDDALAA